MMLKMQSVVVCTFQSVIVKRKSPFHQMRTLTLKVIPIRPRFAEHLSLRTLSSSSSLDYSDQSRGGLPRFFSKLLPPSKGGIVRVQGDEFWHMTKVLRLSTNDRIELFNGKGGLIEGCIQRIDRTGLDFVALDDPKLVLPQNTYWHVFAAFGTLKGGRADWLVEKCTIAQSKLSFVAVAEASPLVSVLTSSKSDSGGLIIVGPEGDFTEKELNMMVEAGATTVGLGPLRLRVETATMALLATVNLWSDSQQSSGS
ncbi:hypothetical protein RGQ29_005810 [Quercus rubra]|uniref:16S rRNA (uracil(1498)-N(3))-methyltransferase n=1 Tax=Quercus rubra TaxID=3512 RepID=A0AAN7I7Y1_QUERU|nr:hypothetical protein RGQ29_005810 [Quercus rubra]